MKLIVIGGSPATGKTTLGHALYRAIDVPRVAMDDVKEVLFDVGGYRDRAWSKEIGRIAFPAFQKLVELHLRRGESVIAEATFLWNDDGPWLESIAKEFHADLIRVWLTCDPLIARERFVHRANTMRHPGHCDSLEDVLAEFEERFFIAVNKPLPLNAPTLVMDTTNCPVDLDAAIRFIQKPYASRD